MNSDTTQTKEELEAELAKTEQHLTIIDDKISVKQNVLEQTRLRERKNDLEITRSEILRKIESIKPLPILTDVLRPAPRELKLEERINFLEYKGAEGAERRDKYEELEKEAITSGDTTLINEIKETDKVEAIKEYEKLKKIGTEIKKTTDTAEASPVINEAKNREMFAEIARRASASTTTFLRNAVTGSFKYGGVAIETGKEKWEGTSKKTKSIVYGLLIVAAIGKIAPHFFEEKETEKNSGKPVAEKALPPKEGVIDYAGKVDQKNGPPEIKEPQVETPQTKDTPSDSAVDFAGKKDVEKTPTPIETKNDQPNYGPENSHLKETYDLFYLKGAIKNLEKEEVILNEFEKRFLNLGTEYDEREIKRFLENELLMQLEHKTILSNEAYNILSGKEGNISDYNVYKLSGENDHTRINNGSEALFSDTFKPLILELSLLVVKNNLDPKIFTDDYFKHKTLTGLMGGIRKELGKQRGENVKQGQGFQN